MLNINKRERDSSVYLRFIYNVPKCTKCSCVTRIIGKVL